MLRVYVCANYSQHERMEEIARDIIRPAGYIVDCRWIKGDHQMIRGFVGTGDGSQPFDVNQHIAERDIFDLHQADIVVYFHSPNGSNRGGRHVEVGMALAWLKPVIVVGPRENVFHYLPETIHCDDPIDLVGALQRAVGKLWRQHIGR